MSVHTEHRAVCTLVFAYQQFDAPIAVATNRDELLDRPASPPQPRGSNPRVVAPRDEEAGGTWIGYNDRGLFVAITNRWSGPDLDGERSRGLLVRDALDRATASEAREYIASEIADREYGPFHLLVADADEANLCWWDGSYESHVLPPGLYVIRNVGYAAEYRPAHDGKARAETFFEPADHPADDAGVRQADSTRWARDTLVPGDGESVDDWLDRAKTVLCDHDHGICVHGDGFGTRSSSTVVVGPESRYAYADGKPCETAFNPVAGEGEI